MTSLVTQVESLHNSFSTLKSSCNTLTTTQAIYQTQNELDNLKQRHSKLSNDLNNTIKQSKINSQNHTNQFNTIINQLNNKNQTIDQKIEQLKQEKQRINERIYTSETDRRIQVCLVFIIVSMISFKYDIFTDK